MKFDYEYRTSDNALHKGQINAATRDAAFAALKKQGIKPSWVQESPGLMNKVLGKGKRWIAIGCLAVIAGIALLFPRQSQQNAAAGETYADAEGFAVPIERRQIWGDSAVIAQAESRNWRVAFPNPACRLLALFAQPGQTLSVLPRIPPTIARDFEAALAEREKILQGDLNEYQQMRCIVEGMKQELREYIAAGGTVFGYIKRLQQRQKEEADYLKLAKEELQKEVAAGKDTMSAWQEINRKLRTQGLPALPFPD